MTLAYPGVRDNRSTLNTKTKYDDDLKAAIMVLWLFERISHLHSILVYGVSLC